MVINHFEEDNNKKKYSEMSQHLHFSLKTNNICYQEKCKFRDININNKHKQ